jgi:hypothetical protein
VIASDRQGRILRLVLLVPDIIEAIVAGRTNQALILERLERPLPASWKQQRRCLAPCAQMLAVGQGCSRAH